jgi:hypothetical protein
VSEILTVRPSRAPARQHTGRSLREDKGGQLRPLSGETKKNSVAWGCGTLTVPKDDANSGVEGDAEALAEEHGPVVVAGVLRDREREVSG